MEKQYVYLISEIHKFSGQKIVLITTKTESGANEFVEYYNRTSSYPVELIIEKLQLI